MAIPEFPDSREISLADKPMIDMLLAARRPELSAYTFTNMFAWRESHLIGLSMIGSALLVHYNINGKRICLEPLGQTDVVEVVTEAHKRAGSSDTEFAYFDSKTAALFAGRDEFQVTPDRDNADYLYRSTDLIELNGRKYDGKRNFINRFSLNHHYEYVELDAHTALECHEFARKWCEDRSCHTVEGMRMELCAVYQMLMHFEALGLRGGAIRVGGEIVAFELGEALNPETLVVHAEKADSAYEGLYQLINRDFSEREGAEYNYINREQDLGIPGLRKAKESYHPVSLVEAYRVRF